MKFFILSILFIFFLPSEASAFCIIKKQEFLSSNSTFGAQNSISTTLKWTFKQRLAPKYLLKTGKKGKNALQNLFIIGFLFLLVGVVLVRTSVGFSGIIGAIISFVCLLFGSLILLTAVILSIVN
jgi:hypothetical protein